MRTVIIGDQGTDWTDHPRALTDGEAAQIKDASYLNGIKLHRQFTNSTLGVAARIVKALQSKIR